MLNYEEWLHGAEPCLTPRAVWCAGVPYPTVNLVRVFWGEQYEGLAKLAVMELHGGAVM